MSQQSSGENTYLLVPIVLIAILLSIAVIRGPSLVSSSGIGSAIIVGTPLILATYALMATTIAGRGTIDLAVGPLMAFINVSIVKLHGMGVIDSLFGVFLVGIGMGVLYQIAFALIIIFLRVQPIIVALAGFLALTGINRVILPRPGGTVPDWMSSWGAGETIFTPVLLLLALATGGWLLFTASTFYSNLRMMGYDERAAFTAGVRIYLVRIGAHIIAGVFVGLAAISYTALISSGDPTQGTQMTLSAVTAMVLGGVALSGGRGSIIGVFLGGVVLFLIGYVLATFDFGAVQSYVEDLSYGVILVLSLLLALLVPIIGRHIRFITPYAAFIVLGAVVAGIMLHVATQHRYIVVDDPDAEIVSFMGEAVLPTPETAQREPLLTRYFAAPPVAGTSAEIADSLTFSLSPIQQLVFAAIAVLAVATLTFRMSVAEAASLRLGVFLYAFIGVLVVLLFVVLALGSNARAADPPASPPALEMPS